MIVIIILSKTFQTIQLFYHITTSKTKKHVGPPGRSELLRNPIAFEAEIDGRARTKARPCSTPMGIRPARGRSSRFT